MYYKAYLWIYGFMDILLSSVYLSITRFLASIIDSALANIFLWILAKFGTFFVVAGFESTINTDIYIALF